MAKISIHAPARGATGEKVRDFTTQEISIHAPARGATVSVEGVYPSGGFQSTLPRGERQIFSGCKSVRVHFNPRSREGSDQSSTVGKAFSR